MNKVFNVISFQSTHYAIITEKTLKERFPVTLIPTPRSITASCGLSLKFEPEMLPDVVQDLKTTPINEEMLALYQIEKTPEGDQARLIPWSEI
ncbi:DUF3343 domain-containing protein [Dehalobacterium formicoaceticum]|uniref:DUF3343 domain-containing protein n=1 Tax=Dehalobacterium formicoaceticum TaxID=51515 RepID=A0ABT1Y4J3_9FIRM|nr:DUF3343 domain-containing protein [Dehalobacterium formicoaceticum]MCR6545794.1 DUF3343 domain-containing protein [Dehalobacterium formicoaceticum]